MRPSLLGDAFAHHVWATLRLIDSCQPLDDEQLGTTVPGTYGSIIDTMRHLVESDSWYLFRVSGERYPGIETAGMDLAALREAMEGRAEAWSHVLSEDPDPDHLDAATDDDGSVSSWPRGIRFAQALHHGTDHRSQICTTLTTLGVQPPDIDVWDYGWVHGRSLPGPPPSG